MHNGVDFSSGDVVGQGLPVHRPCKVKGRDIMAAGVSYLQANMEQ